MSLFRKIGGDVKGLLGNEQFLDRLARAQAFAHGDAKAAHHTGPVLGRSEDARTATGDGGSPEPPRFRRNPGRFADPFDRGFPARWNRAAGAPRMDRR